jgi:CXXC-20-CXXC protein
MKMRKCPYCGRRISYTSSFASRRKAEYICQKCGKESKVAVDKKIILFFIVAVVISLAIMAGWILAGLVSNPLGILLVAIPLIIFTAVSPNFVHYEPYKKYRKSMEAKKAGIAYSDNLLTSELDEDENYTFPSITPQQNDTDDNFEINTDVFNKIRAERNAARQRLDSNEISSDSSSFEKQEYVSVINNTSENHASSGATLKKIHSEMPQHHAVNRSRHYINSEEASENKKTDDGNRYSVNRKF